MLRGVWTVVVVDDDDGVRDALAEALTAHGYDVLTAVDGGDALEVLRAAPRPCVAVVDLVMPRVDGWTLVRALAGDGVFAGVAVVCCTAGRDAAPPGCAVILRKPFDEAALLGAVERALATVRRPT